MLCKPLLRKLACDSLHHTEQTVAFFTSQTLEDCFIKLRGGQGRGSGSKALIPEPKRGEHGLEPAQHSCKSWLQITCKPSPQRQDKKTLGPVTGQDNQLVRSGFSERLSQKIRLTAIEERPPVMISSFYHPHAHINMCLPDRHTHG